MPKLDLPVEEEPAAPAANIGGGLINLLGKTLSGTATDRDPFGEAKKEKPAQAEPAAKTDDCPAHSGSSAPAADPFADPFADGAAKKEEAKKPADKAADPFK